MNHPTVDQPVALGISIGLDVFATMLLSILVAFTWGYIYYAPHSAVLVGLMALATMLYFRLFLWTRQHWVGMGHASKAMGTFVAGSMAIGFLAALHVTGLNDQLALPSNLFEKATDTAWIQGEKQTFIFWSNVAMGLSIFALLGSFSSLLVRANTSMSTINAIKLTTISAAMVALWMISFLSGRAHGLGALLG